MHTLSLPALPPERQPALPEPDASTATSSAAASSASSCDRGGHLDLVENKHRREWAQLDTLGPRPPPQVCMNCYGGSYDQDKHLAIFARFLPVDPNVVLWSDEPGLTRDDQEERIRQINALAMQSPLTPAQREMLTNLYSGNVNVAGTRSAKQWFPAA